MPDARTPSSTPGAPRRASDVADAARSHLEAVWALIDAQTTEIVALQTRLADAHAAPERERRLEARVEALSDENRHLAASRDAARDEAERLREEIRSLREDRRLARPAPRAETPTAGSGRGLGVRVAEASDDPDSLAGVFRQWCRQAGGLNGRADLFASFLGETLPGAAVRVVYRDADSPARPVVLAGDRAGNSAVAYWAVAHDGVHRLVPEPMGTDQFRELAPCFTGAAAPAALSAIEPAPLRVAGRGYELVQPGHVA